MTFFRLLLTSKTNRENSCQPHILTKDLSLVQLVKQRLGNTSVGIFNPNIPLINWWQPALCSIEIDFQIRVIAIKRIPTFLDLCRRRRWIYHQQAFQTGALPSTRTHLVGTERISTMITSEPYTFLFQTSSSKFSCHWSPGIRTIRINRRIYPGIGFGYQP